MAIKNYQLSIVNYQLKFYICAHLDQPLAKSANVALI